MQPYPLRRDAAMFRAFGRQRARNWRLMQERDEKRKRENVLEDNLAD